METAKLWSYKEAANYLNTKVPTIRQWVKRRKIPYIRISERSVRFDPVEIKNWLEEKKHDAK